MVPGLLRRGGARDGAELALAVFCHRVRKYIGAYLAVLGRVDAVAFTAGIGENAAPVRARSLAGGRAARRRRLTAQENWRSRRLLVTTNTELNAIAAPAIIGLSRPA